MSPVMPESPSMKSKQPNRKMVAVCDEIDDHLARLTAFVKERRKAAKGKKSTSRGELGDLHQIREAVEKVVPLTF